MNVHYQKPIYRRCEIREFNLSICSPVSFDVKILSWADTRAVQAVASSAGQET